MILFPYFSKLKIYFPAEDKENCRNLDCSSSCCIPFEAEGNSVQKNVFYTV